MSEELSTKGVRRQAHETSRERVSRLAREQPEIGSMRGSGRRTKTADKNEDIEMAKSVNKVILLGNVGKDPEIRSTGGGKMVASFSLATSMRYKDQQGNWQDRTEWHNIVAYEKLAEIIRDYVKKGSKLFVEGRLTTRNWEDKEFAGRKVYRTEIIVNDLSLLSGREDGTSRPNSSAANFDQRPAAAHEDYGQAAEISDEDIPF